MPLGGGGREEEAKEMWAGNVNIGAETSAFQGGLSEGAWVLFWAILDCVNIFLRGKERGCIHRADLRERTEECLFRRKS